MEQLAKNVFSPAFFEKLCPILKQMLPQFDSRDFIFRIFNNRWPDLDLNERARHIAWVLHHFFPKDFEEASVLLVKLSTTLGGNNIVQQGYETVFISEYIRLFGAAHHAARSSIHPLEFYSMDLP